MSESPFTIEVYDKAFARQGTVGDPISLVVTVRHNQQSTAALTIRSNHRRAPALAAPGARVVIRYRDEHLLSGPVRLRSGEGPSSSGTITFQVADDFRLLSRVLAWPYPQGTLAQQNLANYAGSHDLRVGDAESVLRGFVQANAITRLGLPLTLGTNGNRGATIRTALRFHPLSDRLLSQVDKAGVGVTVRQLGTGLRLDCYSPAVYPRTLSEESGVVQAWSWSRANPDATRVVGGAQGERDARSFRGLVSSALESGWGDVMEVFRDARDIDTTETGWEDLLDERMQEALDEAAPKAGLALTLTETPTFRYDPTGTSGVRVGDQITVEVGAGVTVVDVLREATLSWTAADGLRVTPVVGDRTDDPNRTLIRAVAALASGLRDATRR